MDDTVRTSPPNLFDNDRAVFDWYSRGIVVLIVGVVEWFGTGLIVALGPLIAFHYIETAFDHQ